MWNYFTVLSVNFNPDLWPTGEIPGEAGDAQYDAILASMAKTEMSLTLTNKFELQEDDDSDKKRLFIKWVFFVENLSQWFCYVPLFLEW